ncbi:MAG: response regulator transcription factor [Bauldia sp.]
MRILLVEDEPRIATDIEATLKASGYAVDRLADGEAAWFQGETETYDAAILDIGLPKLDGLTVLRRWRDAGRRFPVLMLTARGAWTERVEGIDAGADDYLPKPFQMGELLARLRAILRRATGQASTLLTIGDVALDTRQMRISVRGVALTLSPLEYRLLAYLFHQAGRVVPSTELADHLYERDHDRDPNAIEAIVARLRRKLGVDIIETRRGFGYIVEEPRP